MSESMSVTLKLLPKESGSIRSGLLINNLAVCAVLFNQAASVLGPSLLKAFQRSITWSLFHSEFLERMQSSIQEVCARQVLLVKTTLEGFSVPCQQGPLTCVGAGPHFPWLLLLLMYLQSSLLLPFI